MPATDSETASMEDHHLLENGERSLTDTPSAVPPAAIPPLTPRVQTTARPNFTSETEIETKAVSMASNDCSSANSSPAEASPAKPAVTSPATFNGSAEPSPATSHIASAADSLTCMGTSLVSISEPPPLLPALLPTIFGGPDVATDVPAALIFKGVSVTLENNGVWKQFNSCGTEMILTKQGRRMFPYCRYRLSGLEPTRLYSLVLSIVPSDQYRYRWSTSKWEVNGPAENRTQGLIRAFSHHYSPCLGSEWMGGLVSFYKLKLTNNSQDQEGHIILHSMHRYIPRLHVIPVPEGDVPTPDQPVVVGPESMTFTFPQTEFMAVTTYQNFRITQLKINHNPFAKGFREDGNNPRLNRIMTAVQPVAPTPTQPSALTPAEPTTEIKEEVVDLSTKNDFVSATVTNQQETRLVLKPIMSNKASKNEQYVPCIRGKHALGELVLVQNHLCVEPKEETHAVSVTPNTQQGFGVTPAAISVTPSPTKSTPGLSPRYRKRRKRINRRWANSRGREWKAATASATVLHSPSLTVAMQPELDDVEGLLFVSFSSKEALEVHVGDKPANESPSAASPISPTTQIQLKQTEVIPETDEDKMARFEAILRQDLSVLKHRQTIHPVLQEVGLKLSSLDPTKSVDLQYLGVRLPLPPPDLPEQGSASSPGDEGLPFISRTGKTRDMTKIKGWKNKFIRSKETSPSNCDGSQKNLSAFCSNMLDEYLESEAQYISERAAAFSTNPEGSVAYQLPAKSASYVKTLDSVLKRRNAASKLTVASNRPCPLSHKPRLGSALRASAPRLTCPAARTGAQAASAAPQPGAVFTAASGSNSSVQQRLSTHQPGVSQRPVGSFGLSQGMTHRPSGLTKLQLKLMQMETGALNEGLIRTQLTPGRLVVALSVLLTKEMLPSQVLKVPRYPKTKADGHECGQDFCTMGCVCASLQYPKRGSLHCRRPECMFGCACFKRRITKQLTAGESEQLVQPVYSWANMEHAVQPRPGCHADKLWNRTIDDVDPDPLFAPESVPLRLSPVKAIKRSSVPHPSQPIREEDKDPVYKYLESMMTCARVREFNSKPPEVITEPMILNNSTPKSSAKPEKKTTDDLPKMYYRRLLSLKKAENTSNETEVRKQVEIQSACQWKQDRKKVLEALCRRMNQNRLSRRFYIGPYCIRPVAKIFMRKPSGSLITYRVRITKPSEASDNDEDEFGDSDEERQSDRSFDRDMDAEKEDAESEGPVMRIGVTPFLSGVLPAGKLRARTKPVGCQAYGLIQVNGKSYNQARLLLGNMGSLHPANRLAAYVTGRLRAPADVSPKTSQKSEPTNKINTPGTLHIKAAGTVVPPTITARKTTELRTPTQRPVQLPQLDSWRKGSMTSSQHSQSSSTISSVHTFVSGQRSSVSPFQNSSPVSLTVSPSLKTPSFLGQSGTYSFRICPPANQSAKGQNPPGVILPGGFTLIQLPKHGADGDGEQSESVNTTNMAGVEKAPPPQDALLNSAQVALDSDANWLGLNTSFRAKELGSVPGLTCDERIPSVESDEANIRPADKNLDIASDDLSSESSDSCEECDKDDLVVDIETVEEVRQGMIINKMKEAARKALKDSRDSSDDFGSAVELGNQDQMECKDNESKMNMRRKNHTVVERQRRSEQRDLFDKLQVILQSDPRAPRLRLLSLAVKEIQNLCETSKYLEEQRMRLIQIQSVYVKELSLLTGKSDDEIRHRLKEVYDRQKMREKTMKWSPFFSHLLQSRAALLQDTNSQLDLKTMPLLQPDFFHAPSSPHMTAAQNSGDQTPSPDSLPLSVSSLAQFEGIAPSPQTKNNPGEPGVPAQLCRASFQTDPPVPLVTASLQTPAAQDGVSPTSPAPNADNPSAQSTKSFTLPLIRSKTGRIILPSSLKPIGQGFYTLMVMDGKQKEEDGKVIVQPSDTRSPNNRESVLLKSDHPSESGRVLDENKTRQPLNPRLQSLAVKAPLAELVLLNKSIFVPPVAPQDGENSQEGGPAAILKKTPQLSCLSFNHTRQSPCVGEPEPEPDPEPSPSVARRGRGRPRKNPTAPVSPVEETENPSVVEDYSKSLSESETSILIEERQSKKIILEVAKDSPANVGDNLAPVKRGRGRPPKKKSVQLWSPPRTRAGSSPSKSNEDSPIARSSKSPDADAKPVTASHHVEMNKSRPLTRGALGKDFPSAKKRSWIDVEKELEPEFEYE